MKQDVYLAVHRSGDGWEVCDGYDKSCITFDPIHAIHPCKFKEPGSQGWIKLTGTFEVIPCPVLPPPEKEVIKL